MMSERILTLPRMARRLGVSQTWLKTEAEAGNVPCLKAGRGYLFKPEAVEETLARRAASSMEAARR